MSTPENPPASEATLRDEFAKAAMQGWIANGPKISGENLNGTTDHAIKMADLSFIYADAMLAARNRAGEEGRS